MQTLASPLNIVWVGGVFRHSAIEASSAIAPAANLWQRKVVQSLRDNGHCVQPLAHYPDRVFPYGSLFPGHPSDFDEGFVGEFVPHLNLPVLRTPTLIASYQRVFKRLLKKRERPDCLLSYNPMPWNAALGRWAQKTHDIPWISLNLDFDDPGQEWKCFIDSAGGARGQVFLSWYAYQNCPIGPKYHFDALANFSERRWALTENNNSVVRKEKSIVYAGSFNKWTGVHDLVGAFCQLDPENVWLDLCGHAHGNEGDQLAERHPRIRFHGLVSDTKLEAICAGADLLVNPRPGSISGNEMNFPSKLMEYLSYGIPVVSTWTWGLAPVYKDLIIECEEGPTGIEQGLSKGLSIEPNQKSGLRKRVKMFLTIEREPKKMVNELVCWIKTCL